MIDRFLQPFIVLRSIKLKEYKQLCKFTDEKYETNLVLSQTDPLKATEPQLIFHLLLLFFEFRSYLCSL